METLQQGLVPVHVSRAWCWGSHISTSGPTSTTPTPTPTNDLQLYSDVAWVPYAELYPQFGFASSLKGLPALLEMQARAAKEGGAAKAKLDEQVAQMRVLQGDDGAAIEKLRADMVAQLDAAEATGGEVAAALLAQQLRPMVDDMLGADVDDSEGGGD